MTDTYWSTEAIRCGDGIPEGAVTLPPRLKRVTEMLQPIINMAIEPSWPRMAMQPVEADIDDEDATIVVMSNMEAETRSLYPDGTVIPCCSLHSPGAVSWRLIFNVSVPWAFTMNPSYLYRVLDGAHMETAFALTPRNTGADGLLNVVLLPRTHICGAVEGVQCTIEIWPKTSLLTRMMRPETWERSLRAVPVNEEDEVPEGASFEVLTEFFDPDNPHDHDPDL